MQYKHITHRRRMALFTGVFAVTALGIAGCASGDSNGTTEEPVNLTLVTHDSFALADGTLEEFTAETGIEVTHMAAGDAGALVNQLVLTKDSPLGDVVFGIDNNLAGRAVTNEILIDYVSENLSDAEAKFLLPDAAGGTQLTPITSGDVCVNIDSEWFGSNNIEPPVTLEDLTDPAYSGLFSTPGASTSSPGLAFLLATIAEFGEGGWQDYWADLVENDVRITSGWSDAYYVDFTAGGGDGDRPIVLSYGSSPAFAPTTASLDETCYRQVEYAGVISGTEHEAEAKQLVDFLFSTTVQNDIAEYMWVFPTNQQVTLPAEWLESVSIPESALALDPIEVEDNRENWILEWSQIATP